jgi:hypothetical protein
VVLFVLQGKGHAVAPEAGCAQRSLSAASLFGYFCGDKSNWPSRGQERDDVSSNPTIAVTCLCAIASYLAMTLWRSHFTFCQLQAIEHQIFLQKNKPAPYLALATGFLNVYLKKILIP